MAKLPIRSNYDDIVDVLYLTVGQAKPHTYEEDDDGLVWRFDERGHPYGVTIFDFKEFWYPKGDVLVSLITSRLGVSVDTARKALTH